MEPANVDAIEVDIVLRGGKGGEGILLLGNSGACLRRIVRLAASRKSARCDMVDVDASAISFCEKSEKYKKSKYDVYDEEYGFPTALTAG